VDASAASGFRSKWRRVLVGAAGMLTELFIAAIFLLIWVAAEPGLVRALAFNIILIAGVSTLIFNGNPLLRYDAYYIFSDLIEMPNLASRGTRHWRYLIERHIFKMRDVEPAPLSVGERRWIAVYTPAALIYRTFVLVAIVLYIASEWFFIGVLLAIFGAVMMLGMPLAKLVKYLMDIPRSAGSRKRAMIISGSVLGVFLLFVLVLPMPLRIGVEGVVWLPDAANVRAGTDGFVEDVLAASGSEVVAGQALVESRDPELTAALKMTRWRLAELEAELDSQRFEERVEAGLTRQEIFREQLQYNRLLERNEQLVARSAVAGRFVIDRTADIPGRYFSQGELFGYVIQDSIKIIRIVVSQDDVDLVRNRLQSIDVRLAERMEEVYPAKLIRAVPAAKDTLPSNALSTEGGGEIAADPRDPKSGKTLERMFQFDLELPPEVEINNYGGRAHVRLALSPEPLAWQWGRRLRQLVLERFSV
jgi:putative peptide zinc metalloprotease protein